MFRISKASSGRNFAAPLDDKTKIIIAAVALVVAVGVLALTFMGGGESKIQATGNPLFKCVDPKCGHEWTVEKKQLSALYDEIPIEEQVRTTYRRIKCPKCRNPKGTGIKGYICPKCKEYYISKTAETELANQLGFRVRPYRGPVSCSKCGLEDVKKFVLDRTKGSKDQK